VLLNNFSKSHPNLTLIESSNQPKRRKTKIVVFKKKMFEKKSGFLS
jgi:hypothetical protein